MTAQQQLARVFIAYAAIAGGIVGVALVKVALDKASTTSAIAAMKAKAKTEYGNCTFVTNGTIEEQVASLRIDV